MNTLVILLIFESAFFSVVFLKPLFGNVTQNKDFEKQSLTNISSGDIGFVASKNHDKVLKKQIHSAFRSLLDTMNTEDEGGKGGGGGKKNVSI